MDNEREQINKALKSAFSFIDDFNDKIDQLERQIALLDNRLDGFEPEAPPEVETDPNLSDVVSLMSFDGDLSDLTGKSWSGSASTSTAQKRFGSASLRTTKGTGAQFIEGPTSADWAFGTGDFTVECWVRADNITTGFWHSPMGNWSGSSGWCFFIDNLARLRFHVNGASISGGVISAGTWHHIAADRQGSDLRIYVDGVVAATVTDSTNLARTDGIRVGQNRVGNNDGLPGYVDEVRITKGVARYAGAFTPPASPFPRQ